MKDKYFIYRIHMSLSDISPVQQLEYMQQHNQKRYMILWKITPNSNKASLATHGSFKNQDKKEDRD